MSWLCKSRQKRPNKTKVGGVTQSQDDSIISVNDSRFTIVLQDFEASVADELNTQRGQVVEALHTDGEWVYVRNVDGKAGYIPDRFCFPLDQMKNNQWKSRDGSNSPRLRPRPKSIHVDVLPTGSSQSSVEVQSINPANGSTPQPRSSTPKPSNSSTTNQATVATPTSSPPTSSRDCTRRRNSGGSADLERASRSINVPLRSECEEEGASNAEACSRSLDIQPSSPRKPTRPKVKRSLSMNTDGSRVNNVYSTRPLHVRRRSSYQEAILTTDEKRYGAVVGIKPSDFQHSPRGSPQNPRRRPPRRPQLNRMNSCPATNYNTTATDGDLDDVFLPEFKRPLGIYRCLQEYRPHFEGEIELMVNELVIMLDQGRSEWAWVITSQNKEGLVPKQLLVRYSPDLGVGGARRRSTTSADATTQTELVVSGPLRHVSSASSASGGPSASSSNSSFQSSSPNATSRRRRGEGRSLEGAMATSAVQTEVSPAWFENVDSLERPAKPKRTQASQKVTPLAQTSTVGNTKRDTPVLTAIRDYTPPASSSNSLRLAKGDVLISQPHMHYPRGWMWVWHSTQRSFGYVPKSSVAYTYNVQTRQRTQTIEDAV